MSLVALFFEWFEKIDIFTYITSAIFNAYLISTLKFQFEKIDKFNNITSVMFNAYLISTLKFEKIKYFWEIQKIWKNKIIDKFNNITSAMFNTYLVSTLKFQFEKNDKFNNITSAMFNAYLISTLKYEKIKCFWVIQKIWKNKKINNQKKVWKN